MSLFNKIEMIILETELLSENKRNVEVINRLIHINSAQTLKV